MNAGALPSAFIFSRLIDSHGLSLLDFGAAAIFELEHLPKIHRDPFDRLLVAQARIHRMTLVTPDPLIKRYEVPVRWG